MLLLLLLWLLLFLLRLLSLLDCRCYFIIVIIIIIVNFNLLLRGHKPTPSQESNTLSEVSCTTTVSMDSGPLKHRNNSSQNFLNPFLYCPVWNNSELFCRWFISTTFSVVHHEILINFLYLLVTLRIKNMWYILEFLLLPFHKLAQVPGVLVVLYKHLKKIE